MFQPGTSTLPTSGLARGDYLFGLRGERVVLHNMQHQDSHEVSRAQLVQNEIITFDPRWSRPVRKKYTFRGLCPTTATKLRRVLFTDLTQITRFWSAEIVEYGIYDPLNTRIINMVNGSIDFELLFISFFEVQLRESCN